MSKVPTDPNMTPEVRRFLDDVSRGLDDLTPGSVGAADATQTFSLHGFISAPSAKDYRIAEYVPAIWTVSKIYTKTKTGTLTATFKINSTAITNGAASVTSTQSSVTPSAANVTAVGDALVMTPSSINSAADFSFTVLFTQTLASS